MKGEKVMFESNKMTKSLDTSFKADKAKTENISEVWI